VNGWMGIGEGGGVPSSPCNVVLQNYTLVYRDRNKI